jgi:hypothetical protein
MLDARTNGSDCGRTCRPLDRVLVYYTAPFQLNSLCMEEWQGNLSDELEGVWTEAVLASVGAVRPSLSRDCENPCHDNQSPGRSSKPQMVTAKLRSSAREWLGGEGG